MTQRVTISLPDDVAERLSQERNASAYVAEALRDRIEREQTGALLADHGFDVTDAGRSRARDRLSEARRRTSPERFAELRKHLRPTTP
jgi:predicted transcriptional regulator